MSRQYKGVVPLALAVWLLAVGLGVKSLLAYAYTPGVPSHAPATWQAARGAFPAGGSLLVMFIHPQCPCSRASISELAKVMARTRGALSARVHVYAPAGMPAGWERTDLWNAAAAIPGVEVTSDAEGQTARAFDARVSGDTQVYGANRALVFSGGLTSARGHEGDSDGSRAILAHVFHAADRVVRTPVFGCYLHPSSGDGTELRP